MAHTSILIVIRADNDRGLLYTTASFTETREGVDSGWIDLGCLHSDGGEFIEWQTERKGILYIINYYFEPEDEIRVKVYTEETKNGMYQDAFPNWIAQVHLPDKTIEHYNTKGRTPPTVVNL